MLCTYAYLTHSPISVTSFFLCSIFTLDIETENAKNKDKNRKRKLEKSALNFGFVNTEMKCRNRKGTKQSEKSKMNMVYVTT